MIKDNKGFLFLDREVSWLRFNERVLQEAENAETPLMERIKFLAIFSSNLDEFFRVRVAQLRRLQKINGKKAISPYQYSPDEILAEIQRIVVNLQNRFTDVYNKQIIPALENRKIFFINEKQVNNRQEEDIKIYFKQQVLPHLFPVIIDRLLHVPHLKDRSIYLAIKMSHSKNLVQPQHALIEVPTAVISRFYLLKEDDGTTNILMLEDIIRLNLSSIFSIFDYDKFEAYIIKITRDAEFDISKDDDTGYQATLLSKIQKSIKQRSRGTPTRFVYDEAMPKDMLDLLVKKLELKNVNLIPGGRYHNFKDFMDFPKIGKSDDYYESLPQIPVYRIEKERTVFDAIDKGDIMIHHPYQSFDYLIRMLREAAIDPSVTTIRITLYRVAKHSNVVNALINAVKNGKKVIVLMELQARFDEESNIYWTTQLQEAGAMVFFGKPGQKVHCKFCLIERNVNEVKSYYAHLSTGNYNGVTARIYSDICLFTKNIHITRDLMLVSDILFNNLRRTGFKELLVAPEFMKKQFLSLINNEAINAREGKPAYIIAKMNSLVDVDVIKALYAASNAGVKINLIVRGICCLVPGIANLSSNIKIISIIDRFLEHTRCYIFCNNNNEKVYLASADWMTRNLENRIEIAFPIIDETIKKKIINIINIQLADNASARLIDGYHDNIINKTAGKVKVRTQLNTYQYLKQLYHSALNKE
ncbi:MAG: polyphosphate kinase 1 [Bacteroidia bacterium]